jgi:hypothetical protein
MNKQVQHDKELGTEKQTHEENSEFPFPELRYKTLFLCRFGF